MSIGVDNPLKWLLAELPAYLTPHQLAGLMERFEANKRRYYRAVKIHDYERRIRYAGHYPPSPEREAQVKRWRAKLDQLREEESDADVP